MAFATDHFEFCVMFALRSERSLKLADLPGGPINHHWTKGLVASPDGTKLYATVGSNSNVGENGIEAEKDSAGILEIDIATGSSRVFASGLRNPMVRHGSRKAAHYGSWGMSATKSEAIWCRTT